MLCDLSGSRYPNKLALLQARSFSFEGLIYLLLWCLKIILSSLKSINLYVHNILLLWCQRILPLQLLLRCDAKRASWKTKRGFKGRTMNKVRSLMSCQLSSSASDCQRTNASRIQGIFKRFHVFFWLSFFTFTCNTSRHSFSIANLSLC